jgi:hypothetical protein
MYSHHISAPLFTSRNRAKATNAISTSVDAHHDMNSITAAHVTAPTTAVYTGW